jgi:hypothetical protein
MGLLGMVGRTAVISATANATMNAQNQRRARRSAEMQGSQPQYAAQAPPPPQAQAPAPQPAAGATMEEKLLQIERLGQLKAQGILTDEEFAQQKSVVLAS